MPQKTVALAQAGLLLTSRSWKGELIWNRLIRRSFPSDGNLLEMERLQLKGAVWIRKLKFGPLVQILKMMKYDKYKMKNVLLVQLVFSFYQ